MKRKKPNIRRALFRISAPGLAMATLMSATSVLTAKPSWAPGPLNVIMSPGITAATCSAQKRDNVGNLVSATNAFVFGMFDVRTPSVPNYTTLNGSATGSCRPT
ncbi:MAG: hypothetical protein OSB05_04330 [Akkermansiaceae bacterium]|nr:hypothetical protein [Akkermansiaceae bacterium]